MTSYKHDRTQLLNTFKDVGTVTEVFELNQADRFDAIMKEMTGPAAIGHVRYATCGKDDRNHAQPFERPHVQKGKWFSFAFNGQLANYAELKDEIVSRTDFHLARETDTEVIMHALAHEISGDRRPTFAETLSVLAKKFDGAYNIAYINAHGGLFVSRDSLGIRPLCYAREGSLFAAASESVALSNLGFRADSIHSLEPGSVIIIENDEMRIENTIRRPSRRTAFSSGFTSRTSPAPWTDAACTCRARVWGRTRRVRNPGVRPAAGDTIVVPVPDTAKAAADAMAYKLGIPCLEG